MVRPAAIFAVIALPLLAWLGEATPARAGAAEGMAAWRQGDFARALREWEPLAVRGDRVAQFNLGLMYENGQGVGRDTARAALWYRKSAEQGYAEAQNNLGRMYYMGDGVPEDYGAAVALFHRAAEQGVPFAHFFLGMIFAAGGKGVQPDPVQAYKWLTLAAALHTVPRYREDALSSRKPVAAGMSPGQIAVAEQLAHSWMTEFRKRTEAVR
jgi:hypothetical protein